jgi:hypothetical protein
MDDAFVQLARWGHSSAHQPVPGEKSLLCRAWCLLSPFREKLTENLQTHLLHVICSL